MVFSRFLDKISFLSDFFFLVGDIEPEESDYDDYDIDLESERKLYLIPMVKYFIWRKCALIWLLMLVILDFACNVLSYRNDLIYFPNNQTSSYLMEGSVAWNNSSHYIIELLHPQKAKDYFTSYTVISSFCLFLEIVSLGVAWFYHKNWYVSSKWVRWCLYYSLFWIYLLYLNPVLNYLRLQGSDNANNYTLFSYTYLFILASLLKEVLPLIFNIGSGLIWSSANLKYLFPTNILVGYLYQYGHLFLAFSTGFLFLLINQLCNNYLVAIGILMILVSYLIPYYLFRERMTLCYVNGEESDVRGMVLCHRSSQNVLWILGCIFFIIYCLLVENPLKTGMYQFYSWDVIHFIVKLFYRAVFFRIVITDGILNMLFQIEKQRSIYQNEVKEESKNFRDIDNQLYMRCFYSYSRTLN